MKIFLGTTEIAGMMTFVSKALQNCGHQVTTCSDNYGSTFFDYKYDIIINSKPIKHLASNRVGRKVQEVINGFSAKVERNKIFRNHRDEHDVYIFMWNGFFPSDIGDYHYLKKRGKKIISLFLGSDIRHVSAFAQEYNLDITSWERWFHSSDLNQQLFRLRKAELFSDAIFSVPDQSGLAIRPYYKIFIPFDVSTIEFNIPRRTIPKIVHIPSRSGIKGTSFIIQTLEKLESEGYTFDFEFITGISNKEVLSKLWDADILIDELFLHGPGTLSLEGIASGCAVATKTHEVYEDVVCNVNFENLEEKIKRLITDVPYRIAMTIKAYESIRTLNNPERIALDILRKAEFGLDDENYDYKPRFFSDRFILPQGYKLNSVNLKLTQKIVEKYNLVLDTQRMRKEGIL